MALEISILRCSSVPLVIQGQKKSSYLLKPGDFVAFDSSIQDEGRAEAEDVSQQCVELHRRKSTYATS